MRVVRFRPEIAEDVGDAMDWYDDKRDGLGDEFAAEFWTAIERITIGPLAYAVNETGLRA